MRKDISVRDRILQTAGELFYREGVRAVGVDLIVAQSGVAKTSLYRHFASKDDLVAAFVQKEDDEYWVNWDVESSRHREDARAELEAQIAGIARHIVEPGYRGCPFLNVASEFPERDHPVRVAATKISRNYIDESARSRSAYTRAILTTWPINSCYSSMARTRTRRSSERRDPPAHWSRPLAR